MSANEHTALLHAQSNGNGVVKKNDKLIIPMPKDPIFLFENFWGGLSLEELLPYQDDPWWQRLRNTLLYSCWLMVLLTFMTACIMAYFHSGSCKMTNAISTMNSIISADTVVSTTMMGEVLSSTKFALPP